MRYALLLLLLALPACAPALGVAATPSVPAPAASAAESAAEAVVQAQLEAYNRRDLEAFLATYAPDAKIYDHPDRLRMDGIEQLRRRYGQLVVSAPALNAVVGRRIVQGRFVIDHESVTGFPGAPLVRAVAIYEVRDGRIQNVWFIG